MAGCRLRTLRRSQPIARMNSPLAKGEAICELTENDPALSPKIVTLVGSPPNASMLSRTQRIAARLVHQAIIAGSLHWRLGGQVGMDKETEDSQPVIHRDRRPRRSLPGSCRPGAALNCRRQ